MDTKTFKWLSRHADLTSSRLAQIAVTDSHTYGRVAVAADGYRLAIARVEDPVGLYPAHGARAESWAKFPDWEQIPPRDLSTSLTVDTTELYRALSSAAIFSRNDNHRTYLTLKRDTLLIGATANDGDVTVSVRAEINGTDPGLVINTRFLITALSGWTRTNQQRQHLRITALCPRTRIYLGRAYPSPIIVETGCDDYPYRAVVIMPMWISGKDGYTGQPHTCPQCGHLYATNTHNAAVWCTCEPVA